MFQEFWSIFQKFGQIENTEEYWNDFINNARSTLLLLAFIIFMYYNNSNIMKFGVRMKEILKDGGKLFLKTVVVNIMCFFIVI